MTDLTLTQAQEISAKVARIYLGNCDVAHDDLWALMKLQEELGELTSAHLSATGRSRRRGKSDEALRAAVEDEAADLLGFLLVFAAEQGIDLGAALMRKWGKYLPEDARPAS